MLSRGVQDPRPIANVMNSHPDARVEILAMLHATLGNMFVGLVVEELRAAQQDAEPKAAAVGAGPVRVAAVALHVRSSPSSAHKKNIVGVLQRGTVVTAQGKDGHWLRIEHQGQPCFIHGDYVTPVAAPTKKPVVENVGGEEDAGDAAEAAPPTDAPSAPPPTAPPTTTAPTTTAPTPAPAVGPVPMPYPNVGHADLPKDHADTPIQNNPTDPTNAAPTPAPTKPDTIPATPAPTPSADAKQPDPKQPAPPKQDNDLHGTYKGIFSKVYSTGTQKVQVWASEGGVSSTPNIYVHFHGHRTNYGIDPDLKWDASENAPKEHEKKVDKGGSGHRAAQQAMAAAANKNTVVILPQGVLGEGSGGSHEGGYMADLEALGLDGFLKKVLAPLGKDIGVDPLTPGNIGLGGHSSGGYEGMHSALRRLEGKDKDLADHITDITLYDANYGGGAHLDETRAWMIKGKPNKNVRLVNGWGQTTTNKKINQKSHDLWFNRFGEAALTQFAKAHGMTVRPVPGAGDKLDKETSIVQHSQVINKDGAVQCDVLILMFSSAGGNDHEALRDREIDDAIMSIGDGAAGNATFGHHDKGKLKEEHAELQREKKDADTKGDVLAEVPANQADAKPAPNPIQPQTEHKDGPPTKDPEPVTVPGASSSSIPKELEKARKIHKKEQELFDHLYNEKDGAARLSKLDRHDTTKVKNKETHKKETVHIDLTDEQYKFKQKVFVKAVEITGDGLYGGVPKGKLDPIPGTDQFIRKEVSSDLAAMIAAAKAECGVELTVSSGYRDISREMSIWNHAFNTIYLWLDHKEREAKFPDDPYGDAAALWLAQKIASRKAVPGTSNHSNGIAVDLTGPGLDINYDNQKAYKASKVYQWLNGKGEYKEAASKRFKFENYHKEAWHYDWRGKVDE